MTQEEVRTLAKLEFKALREQSLMTFHRTICARQQAALINHNATEYGRLESLKRTTARLLCAESEA